MATRAHASSCRHARSEVLASSFQTRRLVTTLRNSKQQGQGMAHGWRPSASLRMIF